MGAKKELLEGFEELESKKVDFTYLFYVLGAIFFAFMVAFPKIYLSHQIYYKSRKIAKLEAEYEILKEENREIKASVEKIKFKNKIKDTLF